MQFNFRWDPAKALANWRKHGVSFEEAATVFRDTPSMTSVDTRHSIGEWRWLDLGRSGNGRLLVVSYTQSGRSIRLISARLATGKERRKYEEGS